LQLVSWELNPAWKTEREPDPTGEVERYDEEGTNRARGSQRLKQKRIKERKEGCTTTTTVPKTTRKK
jgi:hypothetical protein